MPFLSVSNIHPVGYLKVRLNNESSYVCQLVVGSAGSGVSAGEEDGVGVVWGRKGRSLDKFWASRRFWRLPVWA